MVAWFGLFGGLDLIGLLLRLFGPLDKVGGLGGGVVGGECSCNGARTHIYSSTVAVPVPRTMCGCGKIQEHVYKHHTEHNA